MKIDAHENRHYRVWLDGVEVTQDCEIAILDEFDEPDAVLLLKRNAKGHHYLEDGKDGKVVAKEWKSGAIVIQHMTEDPPDVA